MSQGVRKFAVIAAGLCLLMVIVALLMPKDRADQLSDSILRLSGNSGMACLDFHRKSLKDPESARLTSSTLTGDINYPEVTINYRAQNSYGAYIAAEAHCTLNPAGKVEEALTNLGQATRMELVVQKKLERELKCLQKRSTDRKENNPAQERNYRDCIVN